MLIQNDALSHHLTIVTMGQGMWAVLIDHSEQLLHSISTCEAGTITAQKNIFSTPWNITKSSKRPSKYHLSINFVAQEKIVFPISEKLKTRNFQ